MPRVKAKGPRIDPDATYVAWQGAALSNPDITLAKGARLKGSHPAVQKNFWLFAEDGVIDVPHELDHVIQEQEAAAAALPEHDLRTTLLPVPLGEVVEAVRDIKLLVGGGGEAWTGGQVPGEVVTISAGTRFSAQEAIVSRLPSAFRKV